MGWTPISPWKLGTVQTVSFTGTAGTVTNGFGSETRAILIRVTADAHVRIGQSPTAVSTDTLIKATDSPLVFGCSPTDKISAIQDSAGGTLYVTELSH